MKTNGEMRYEIVNKTVRAWNITQGENEPPCLFQDVQPNSGIPFASDEEAEQWIIAFTTPVELIEEPLTESVVE